MAVEAQSPAPAAPARPRPKREREEEVLVWPDLVFIEFVAAVLFTVTFLILSVFINAPLLNRANLNVTPNPSKAPWYFLNLQELLLHMDKAWAGVLVPTVALIFFAAIPYIDPGDTAGPDRFARWIPACPEVSADVAWPCLRDEAGVAHKGIVSTKDIAKRLEFEALGVKWPEDLDHIGWPFNDSIGDFKFGMFHGWGGEHLNIPAATAEQVIPLSSIAFFAVLIIYILFRLGWVRTRRDVMIVMYTGVMAGYLALALVGSFFRGPGQDLVWPTEIKVDEG